MPTPCGPISRAISASAMKTASNTPAEGWMCDRVVEAGGTVIADFVCPTAETRAAFGEAFTIWVDRIESGRFKDTNRMFVAPEHFDLRVKAGGAPQYWAERALAQLRPAFDPQKPTALFIGRYQPFHGGHQRLIEEGLRRVCAFRRSRPLIPTDRDHLFRSIATSLARVLMAPLDDGGDVSLLWVGQARREAVPVVNRRDPRSPRSAFAADAAARAGGPC